MSLRYLRGGTLLAVWLSCVAGAALATPPPRAKVAPAAALQSVSYSLRELGLGSPLELRGTQGVGSVGFGTRADQVVVGAKLHLRLNYSPAMLGELSHLRIELNDQTIAAVPLPNEQAGHQIERDIDLDPRYFTDYNRLRFTLIGHYSLQCEDPLHTALWASISNDSTLELQQRPLELRDDLALLPAPFFDRRDSSRLVLPIVLPPRVSRAMLHSAGIAASWFGMLADYRSARFPVSLGRAPTRHALVFATNANRPDWLDLPAVTAPTLSIRDLPADPRVKLLVFQGRDDLQLEQAVTGLVLGNPVLSGSAATIDAVSFARRPAYDAPRWVPTSRIVRFGELTDGDPGQLQVSGSRLSPITLNLRLPPDLLTWNRSGVPIDLRYRYGAPRESDDSLLAVRINGQLVRSIRLHPDSDTATSGRLLVPLLGGSAQESQSLLIPAFQVGSDNQLQFQFSLAQHRQGLCETGGGEDISAAIDPDSSIDLRAFPHYTALPNLALFANAGFPFTRYADLGETAFVLPHDWTPAELEELYFILGRMGRQTGAAATSYRLIDPDEARSARGTDLIVLPGAQTEQLLADWHRDLPLQLNAGERRWQDLTPAPAAGFDADPLRLRDSAAGADPHVRLQSGGPLGALIGFESPLTRGRSVVALLASSDAAAGALLDALEDPAKVGSIRGQVAVVRADRVQSFEGTEVYYVGSLPWWTRLWFHLSHHAVLLSLATLAVAITFALWCYGWLQRRAARRLAGRTD